MTTRALHHGGVIRSSHSKSTSGTATTAATTITQVSNHYVSSNNLDDEYGPHEGSRGYEDPVLRIGRPSKVTRSYSNPQSRSSSTINTIPPHSSTKPPQSRTNKANMLLRAETQAAKLNNVRNTPTVTGPMPSMEEGSAAASGRLHNSSSSAAHHRSSSVKAGPVNKCVTMVTVQQQQQQ